MYLVMVLRKGIKVLKSPLTVLSTKKSVFVPKHSRQSSGELCVLMNSDFGCVYPLSVV